MNSPGQPQQPQQPEQQQQPQGAMQPQAPQQPQQPQAPQLNQQQAAQPGVIKTAPQPWGGVLKRLAAALIDGLVLSIFTVPLYAVFLGGVMASIDPQNPDPAAFGAMMSMMLAFYGAVFAINIGYFAFMDSSKFQGSLGKVALGMAVVNQQGRRISFGTALVRILVKMFLSGILLIGYIMAMFDDRKRTLHDRLAKTYVVNKARN